MNLRETYNEIAEEWHKNHQSTSWREKRVSEFAGLLPQQASVLDVGCGTGIDAKLLSEKGLSVTGVDFSERMIEFSRKNAPNAQFSVLDLFQIQNLTERYDGVYLQGVLLHVPKKEVSRCLRRVGEVLKPGGLLYISVKAKTGKKSEEIKQEVNKNGETYERFFSYFTFEELKENLEKFGFSVISKNDDHKGSTKWIYVIARKD